MVIDMTTPEKLSLPVTTDDAALMETNLSTHFLCGESVLNCSIMACDICNQNGENKSTDDNHGVKCS